MRVNELDERGVTLKVLGQARAAEQWSVAGELRKRILAAFASRGIQMPSAQRLVVSAPAASASPPDPTGTPGSL